MTEAEMIAENRQNDAIKRVGLVSLLGGTGLALLKHLNSGSLLADRPANIGAASGSMVEVPVPGQEAIPGTSDFFEARRERKLKGKAKNLGTYNPGKGVAMKEAAYGLGEFKYEDLSNPTYLPKVLAAASLPMLGGYTLLNHLLAKKVKSEKAQEVEDAKNEFGQALVEAHSNRLNAPVNAVKSASLTEDLEKLAELHSGVEKKAEDPWWELLKRIPAGIQRVGGAVGDTVKNIPNIAKGYAGAVGALGLGMGGAGLYTGFQDAKKNDTEKLESQRYLNEFLNRRAIEGSPIYSVPVPVSVNQKKHTLRPTVDIDSALEYEA